MTASRGFSRSSMPPCGICHSRPGRMIFRAAVTKTPPDQHLAASVEEGYPYIGAIGLGLIHNSASFRRARQRELHICNQLPASLENSFTTRSYTGRLNGTINCGRFFMGSQRQLTNSAL